MNGAVKGMKFILAKTENPSKFSIQGILKKCLPFIGRPHKVTFPDFNFDMLD